MKGNFISPVLKEYILRRDKFLDNIEAAEEAEKNGLMNKHWQYDSRIKRIIEDLPALTNRFRSDLRLLQKWDSDNGSYYYDLILNAMSHVPKDVHFRKTSLSSRKKPYSGVYRVTHALDYPDGTTVLQETFTNGKGKIISGKKKIINDPEVILLKLGSELVWVDEQIKQKRYEKLERLVDYITSRLEQEKRE